ncbi:MAG: hypothetical protein V4628_11655 [Pseudomonadota bacterium]
MSQYDNTNKGTLGKNRRKEKDTHPSHTGSINIEGKEYWLSAWVKDGSNNEKFFSLSVKPKENAPQQQQRTSSTPPTDSFGDDIPF